jgi:tetratricopeptide (TPR) repeat protein
MLRDYHSSIIRWLFGFGLLGLSYHFTTTGYEGEDMLLVLAGAGLFLLGIVFLWKTIFYLATRPLTRMVDSLFFPGGKLAKPLLNLKLPAYYINEGRYEEALAEYRKILKHYPDEAEAYEKTIWLLHEIFEDPSGARSLIRRAKRRHLTLDQRIVRSVTHTNGFSQIEP